MNLQIDKINQIQCGDTKLISIWLRYIHWIISFNLWNLKTRILTVSLSFMEFNSAHRLSVIFIQGYSQNKTLKKQVL